MKTKTEVAVIGGGIMGCATAYYLAKAKVPVVLLEKAPKVGLEASGANAGGVRQHGRAPDELPLAIASIRLWMNLAEELDFDLEYRQGGHLKLATTDNELSELRESVKQQNALGLHDLYVLDEKQVRELVPHISPHFAGASCCPSDGHASPLRACHAFIRAAERLGADAEVNTEVTGIQVLGEKRFVLETSQGPLTASYVVNCAGSWSSHLAKTVGVELPVTPKYWQCMVTEALPPFLNPVITWPKGEAGNSPIRNFNVKQLVHGQLLLSGGWTGTGNPNTSHRDITYDGVTGHAHDFVSFFSHLGGARLRRAWVGIEGHTPDDVMCMGPVSALPGFYFGGPGTGHSFALGPIVGKLLAELITTGRSSIPIERLSVERFASASTH